MLPSRLGEPGDPTRVGLVQVHDRGHPRVATSLTSLFEEPVSAATARVSSMPSHRRRCSLPEHLDGGGAQNPVHTIHHATLTLANSLIARFVAVTRY
jgi:hypothetical protein